MSRGWRTQGAGRPPPLPIQRKTDDLGTTFHGTFKSHEVGVVRDFDDVDDRRVHGIMRQDLEDVDRFAAAVLQAFPDLA